MIFSLFLCVSAPLRVTIQNWMKRVKEKNDSRRDAETQAMTFREHAATA